MYQSSLNRKDEEMYFLDVFSCWVLGKNSITNELPMVKVTISVKINQNKDPFPKESTPRTTVSVKNLNHRVDCTRELNPIQWGLSVSPGRETGNCCNRWGVQNFHSQNNCITYVESGNYTQNQTIRNKWNAFKWNMVILVHFTRLYLLKITFNHFLFRSVRLGPMKTLFFSSGR